MTSTGLQLRNWSGSHRYRATALHRPRTLDELRGIVAGADSLRVLGTRHSFSPIGDARALVSLEALDGATTVRVDADAMTASVGPAVTYAQLADALDARSVALANLASLPHISVAGATATGSHGSGEGLGNLATSVRGVCLLVSTGEFIELGPGDARLAGATVHLGALGIVCGMTLAVESGYRLRQDVFLELAWDALFEHFDAVFAAGRSVSVFHRFGPRTEQVWVKRDPAREPLRELFGARAATEPCSPIPGGDPSHCTTQLGAPGDWSERLPHFRAGFTPSSGDEIQSELFVARRDARAAVEALRPLADRMAPLLLVAELRTIAADSLWLSPHHGRESVGLHFTWRREEEAVTAVCGEIERRLAPWAPRPHWGKLFCTRADTLAARYPRMDDFRRLRAELDPRGTFTNPWLVERVLGEDA